MPPQTTLYSFVDVDRSRKVRWMLCELDMMFAEQRLNWDAEDHMAPAYLQINPIGRVPAVEINGTKIFESSAICTYLADLYPAKLLAPVIDSPERAEYMSWVFFGATTLENEVMEVIRWRKEPEETERLKEAKEELYRVLAPLEQRIAKQDYICGTKFSAADVIAGFPLAVANEAGLLGDFAAIGKYVERLKSRPAADRSKIFTAKIP